MMQNDIIDQVAWRIRDATCHIYGENAIKSAFITGSVPAGKARPDSDIDIFICYDDSVGSASTRKQTFIDFYFKLHRELGRVPDDISPSEQLSFSELATAIHRIQRVAPSSVLVREDFDAICWVGMLISKQYPLMKDTADMHELKELSKAIASAWARALAPEVLPTETTGEYTDIDKILRRTISSPGYYEAH